MILATKTQQALAIFPYSARFHWHKAYIILHYSDCRLDGRSLRGWRLAEESPDTAEQEVRLQSRMLRTIFRGKESATEKIPPILGKGEMVR
jgi:hypothetical protein